MVWSTPPVFSDGNLLTASQLNTLSADLNETAVAKAATGGGYFVATGTNAIVERNIGFQSVTANETTTSTSFTDLATTGPVVTATSGPRCLVTLTCEMSNNTGGASSYMGVELSGATTASAGTTLSNKYESSNANDTILFSTVQVYAMTAGSNTFTCKYQVTAGTGSFGVRRLIVQPY
jgi:hypothetical protein